MNKNKWNKNRWSLIINQLSLNKGFTLVEMLAVIIVFTVVSSIIVAIISAALRGNGKTNAINKINTNGGYAISQMAKSVRSATELLSPSSCGTVDSPTSASSIQVGFIDGSVTTYSCKDALGNLTITSNSAALIDTGTITVVSCNFTCGRYDVSDYPIIGINFSLQNKTTSTLEEKIASASAVSFQTSVVFRNLIR